MIFENESEEIGRMTEENKVDLLETLVINKKEFEQLFLDFFVWTGNTFFDKNYKVL